MFKKKSGKKTILFALFAVLSVFFCLSVFCSFTVYPAAVASPTYSYDQTVFYIESQEDFGAFSAAFNNYNKKFSGKTIYLLCDIDLSVTPFALSEFAGTLDGFGNSVKNASSTLFSTLSSSATVRNIVFEDVDLDGYLIRTDNGTMSDLVFTGEIRNGALIESISSSGTVTNCTTAINYVGDGNESNAFLAGIAKSNAGAITDCAVTGDFLLTYTAPTSYRVAGVSVLNSGTITGCAVAADITYDETGGIGAVNNVLPELTGIARALNGNGSVVDSFAFVSCDDYDTATLTFATGQTITGTFGIRASFNGVDYDLDVSYSQTNAMTPGTSSDLTNGNLGSAYTFGSTYPVLTGLLAKNSGDYLLSDYGDYLRLRAFSLCGAFSYKNDFYLPTALFQSLPTAVTGFGAPAYSAWTSGGYYGENDFGFDALDTPVSIGTSPLSGDGSLATPYLISAKEDISALDGLTGYAVLVKDILVNSSISHGNEFAIDDLSVTLFGCGRRIVGLNGSVLAATVSGRVDNVVLAGVGGYLTDDNTGTLSRVTTEETDALCGFAATNEGTIRDCTFNGDGTNAFCVTNDGTVERCIIRGTPTTVFTLGGTGAYTDCLSYVADAAVTFTGVDRCIVCDTVTPTYAVVLDGVKTTVPDVSVLTLSSYGFDLSSGAFGYRTGENMPSLRQYGLTYKVYYNDAFSEIDLLSWTYPLERAFTRAELEASMIAGDLLSDTTFVWTYEGDPFSGVVENAGAYTVTATYAGDNDYLAKIYYDEFTVEKAEAILSISFAEGAFDDYHKTYDGQNFAPAQPTPTNSSELTAAGYGAVQYVFKKGNSPVSYACSAGTYTQTATVTSVNYEDITVSRTVTVNKATLNVSIGNTSCDYLSAVDLTSTTASITSGLVSADSSLSLTDLVGDYSAYFTADYSPGDPVGDYEITFLAGLVAENYELSATAGTLTVHPIDFPISITSEITFYGATPLTPGSTSTTYTGSAIALSATYPAGVSVSYSGNDDNVAVDTYSVSASFSKANYNDYVLTANLTVEKANLSVVLPSGSSDYSAGWSIAGSPTVTGFLGEDTAALLSETTFTYRLEKSGVVVGTTGSENLSADVYDVTSPTVSALQNYAFSYTPGVYTVNKISLTTLYDGADFTDVNKFYDGDAVVSEITYFETEGYSVEMSYSLKKNGVNYEGAVQNAGIYVVTATATPTSFLATNYVATQYTRTITILQLVSSVSFASSSYTVVYDGTDCADKTNFSFTGTVNVEDLTITLQKSGAPCLDAVHPGVYAMTATYAGDENHSGCSASATLTVQQKGITLAFRENYVYNGDHVVPELLSLSGTISGETLTASNLSYAYYNSSDSLMPGGVINASSTPYHFIVTIDNTDYYPVVEQYDMIVSKLPVDVHVGQVGYFYGTTGNITPGEVTYFVNQNGFSRRNYPVLATTVDVLVNLPGHDAGIYYLTDDSLVDTTNYDFFLTGDDNVVTISPRTLSVAWTYQNVVIDALPAETEYAGQSLTSRFGYQLSNFGFDEDASILTIDTLINGAASDIYHAGSYTYTINLRDCVNYVLGSTVLSVSVTKAPLALSVGDATVEQGENFVGPAITASGKVGEDTQKDVRDLKGAIVSYVHEYTGSARVNAQFTVSVSATFDDYAATVTHTGTLTVVANPYPDYALETQALFVYDGTEKTVVIKDVDPAVFVSYGNNVHTDVGTYTVSATVTYPSGRNRISTCRMSIVKATPTLSVDPIEVIFAKDSYLTDDMISGHATIIGQSAEVQGTFAFAEENELKEGEYVYRCIFTPQDRNNVNSATVDVTVKCAAIDLSVFLFDPLDNFSFTGFDGNICRASITDTVTMTLDPILDGLELMLNGYVVPYIRWTGTAKHNVSVRLGEKVVLSYVFDVVKPDKEQSVVFEDDVVLSFNNAERKEAVLKVSEGGGRITLAENMKTEYNLYVDGALVNEYVLNGGEGSIAVSVRKKSDNRVVFSQIYTIERATTEEYKEVNYAMYFGIGGGVLGLAAVIAVVLIIWKKKNG